MIYYIKFRAYDILEHMIPIDKSFSV